MTRAFRLLPAIFILACVAVPAAAQTAGDPPPPPPAVSQDDDPDRDPTDAQPAFYVSTTPTTLRLPPGKFNFRLTHRFLRTLGDGRFGDVASQLFGVVSGAQIGLDLKHGLFSVGHVGFYRTSDRTMQFSGQDNAIKQGNGLLGI